MTNRDAWIQFAAAALASGELEPTKEGATMAARMADHMVFELVHRTHNPKYLIMENDLGPSKPART